MRRSLNTPYSIFLRCAGRYTDANLLACFGLSSYRPADALHSRFGQYVALADDGEWTLVADDLCYTLWHMPTTRDAIAVFAEQCDVFACSHGDCDDSFDFAYYRDGRLARQYVVADPGFRGGVVVENIGDPLPGEAAAFVPLCVTSTGLRVAASLGIWTDYTDEDVRFYIASAGS